MDAPNLLTHLRRLAGALPSGNVAEFVLRHGRAFAPPSGPLPQGLRYRRTRKNCYGNACDLMLDRPVLTYVEGYALGFGGLPAAHAWCIDGLGAVVDVSWNPSRVGQSEYFGVPLARDFVRACVVQSGRYGILDPMRPWWPGLAADPAECLAVPREWRKSDRSRT